LIRIEHELVEFVTRTPFTNKRDAFKRLIRYHAFHELDPPPDELEKEEDELEAEQLLTKFHRVISQQVSLPPHDGNVFFPFT
jgi:Conserved region of unknown function on GLTSCR protein